MFLKIENREIDINKEIYINREAISCFYYDDEEDSLILCMLDGSKFNISNETAENLKNFIQPIMNITVIPKKKESAE